jgi:hypothetical protein
MATAQPGPLMPDTVRKAIRLMYIGMALDLLGVVIVGSIDTFDATAHGLSARSTVAADLATAVAEGAVVAGLWLWMAKACGNGRSWGRVVSTVLFGLYCAQEFEVGVIETLRIRVFPVSLLLGLPVWIIGLVTIVLLWNKKSAPYFR